MHPITDKIIRDGPKATNLDALSQTVKFRLYSDAADTLMRQGNYVWAADAFLLAGNKQALRDHGKWLLAQRRFGLAALFLLHTEDESTLLHLAQECMRIGETSSALRIYEKLGDATMVSFLQENK